MNMTKAEIVDIISKGTGLTKVETAAVVDGFIATITYALQNGNHVELRGFGTFCLRERKEKNVPNPRTGEMMHIPHRIVPDFKPSPGLKKNVSEYSNADETKDSEENNNKKGSQTDIFNDLDRYLIDDE